MPEHQQTQKSTESKITSQRQATPRIQAPSSHPMAIIQRARINPKSLTHADVMQLQRTIGNQAVIRLFSEIGLIPSTAKQAPPVQRQEIPEEEEPLQGKMAETIQRQTIPEEESLQGKMIEPIQRQEIPEEEEPLQGKMAETVQRQEIPEEEEPLQGEFEGQPEEETCPSCMQRQEIPEEEEPLQGKFENKPEIACPSCSVAPVVQRQEIPEEEEPLQGKFIGTIQRQEIPEEEEPLQGKMAETVQRQEIPEEEEPLQGKFENKPEIACPSCFVAPIVQRQEIPEEEEPLQGKMIDTVQRQELPEEEEPLQTKRENNTGMPDNLKAGVERLSEIDMSDVRVHYNSDKPAQVGALAYTQGTNIHIAPGQERHLPHETWHIVQQAQGRVRPTLQLKDVSVNDDAGLEHEADIMGAKAWKRSSMPGVSRSRAQERCGQVVDKYEQHVDDVADAFQQGKSLEKLCDQIAPVAPLGSTHIGSISSTVQRFYLKDDSVKVKYRWVKDVEFDKRAYETVSWSVVNKSELWDLFYKLYKKNNETPTRKPKKVLGHKDTSPRKSLTKCSKEDFSKITADRSYFVGKTYQQVVADLRELFDFSDIEYALEDLNSSWVDFNKQAPLKVTFENLYEVFADLISLKDTNFREALQDLRKRYDFSGDNEKTFIERLHSEWSNYQSSEQSAPQQGQLSDDDKVTAPSSSSTQTTRRQYDIVHLTNENFTKEMLDKVRELIKVYNEGGRGHHLHPGVGRVPTMDLTGPIWDARGRGDLRLQFHPNGTLTVVDHDDKPLIIKS